MINNLVKAQRKGARQISSGDNSIFVWLASARGGKTSGIAFGLLTHSLNYKGYIYILAGHSVKWVREVLGNAMRDAAVALKVPYKSWHTHMDIGHNKFKFIGANNLRSQDAIQGERYVAGAWLDEALLMPENFVSQSLTRCSDTKNSILVLSGNKQSPFHWLKKNWIDNEELQDKLYLYETTLDDATFHPPEVIEHIKSSFFGSYYRRNVLNEWAMMEGLVFPEFKIVNNSKINTKKIPCISMDWGTSGITAAILWKKERDNSWIITDEYYYDGNKHGLKNEREQIAAIKEKWNIPDKLIYDPSAVLIKDACIKNNIPAAKGKNDLEKGIQVTQWALGSGVVKIDERCKNLLEELSGYAWDDNEKSDAKPIKKNDHAVDALRYGTMYTVRNVPAYINRGGVKV